MKTIIYTTEISTILGVRIPCKNKDGFLKHAFGGHHYNAKNKLFQNIINEITEYNHQADVFDVDGYLSFHGHFNTDEINKIMCALLKTFPYCTGTEKVGINEFLINVKAR